MSLSTSKSTRDKKCANTPCESCPYREDTPRGVWAFDHYADLTKYDGDIGDQVLKGAFGAFACHKNNGNLCRGWIDCHGEDNLLALRLSSLKAEVGPPTVRVFRSGAEVLEANIPHMTEPSDEATALMIRISGLHERAKSKRGGSDDE